MPTRILSAAVVALAFCGNAHGGDADAGLRLAQSCASCHGSEGRGGGAIPALAGQEASALAARMRELSAADADATIMPRLLRAYDDVEIAALARYFSQVKP
jgi:cytochrome c553